MTGTFWDFKEKKIGLAFLFFQLLFFIACSPKNERPPSGILSKDKMIEVLVDVHIIEALPQSHGLNMNQVNRIMAGKYDTVMKKHNTTNDQFDASYQYYIEHPKDLDEIYQEVVSRLTAMEGKLRANRPVSKKTATDSIFSSRFNKGAAPQDTLTKDQPKNLH